MVYYYDTSLLVIISTFQSDYYVINYNNICKKYNTCTYLSESWCNPNNYIYTPIGDYI